MRKSLYEILNVEKTASKEEIKISYYKLAKEHHPDNNGSHEIMTEITLAYKILSSDSKRAKYDETGSTDSEKPFEQQFMGFLNAILIQIVENEKNVDIIDIVEMIQEYTDDTILKHQQASAITNVKIERYEAVKKRLKSTSDKTMFIILDNQIENLKRNYFALEEEKIFLGKAKKVLEGYAYDVDNINAGFLSMNYTTVTSHGDRL